MPQADTKRRDRIRELNDAFRSTFDPALGRGMVTSGVAALDEWIQVQAISATKAYTAFSADNDPYGEHDFGSFAIGDTTFNWKIDYFDKSLTYGSDDSSDPTKTTRVLTIMLVEES